MSTVTVCGELIISVCPVYALSVEHYVSDLRKCDEAAGEGVYAVPTGAHVKDNEQVCVSFLNVFSSCSYTAYSFLV